MRSLVRYAVLTSVSRRYPPHKGRLLTCYSPVRHSALLPRSTWMCYARRQRSSWARIKLSSKLYYIRPFSRLKSVRAWFALLLVLSMCLEFLQDMLSKNFRDFRTCFFLLVLSSPVVQLSMINHRSYAPPSRWRVLRLGYYTTSGALCQEVLKNFFQNLFENLSQTGAVAPFRTACWL